MSGDAVAVAPQMYKVVLENEQVRVLEVRGKPGDKTALHTHPALVAIAITDGKYRFGSPDGESTDAELKAGQAMFFDRVEHTTEIRGTADVHILLVELK